MVFFIFHFYVPFLLGSLTFELSKKSFFEAVYQFKYVFDIYFLFLQTDICMVFDQMKTVFLFINDQQNQKNPGIHLWELHNHLLDRGREKLAPNAVYYL